MSRRWPIVVGALLVAACSLTTSLDGFTGGDDTPGVGGEGGSEASFNEGGVADRLILPGIVGQSVVIATDVGAEFAAGSAQQTHLHFAKNAGQWVLFYVTDADATHVRTRMSKDFATWTDGTALTLPQPLHDGRNFAVAYADTGGRDVFHLALSIRDAGQVRRHSHARAVIESGALAFDTPKELGQVNQNDSNLDPDGPAVVVLADGKVLDISGWEGDPGHTGNIVAWESMTNDTAASWPSMFKPPFEVYVVNTICNARALVATPGGAIALWESADDDPNPTGVTFSRFENGGWRPEDSVGFERSHFNPNDWGAAAIGGTVHAVRFSPSGYNHRVSTSGNWQGGSAIPSRDHPVAQGVVVEPDGAALLALSLDKDGALASTSLVNGMWTAWKTEVSAGTARGQLSGYSGVAGVAVLWVETVGATKNIVGARLR